MVEFCIGGEDEVNCLDATWWGVLKRRTLWYECRWQLGLNEGRKPSLGNRGTPSNPARLRELATMHHTSQERGEDRGASREGLGGSPGGGFA